MRKKYLIVVLVLSILILAGGGYYYLKTKTPQSVGVLPVTNNGTVNPSADTQSANPYDKTNPFSNIKVNPFE